MTEMRVMTVKQPWAWAIVEGGKDVENRVRNIAGEYRGLVAIHAGLGWSEQGSYDWEVRRATRSVELGYQAGDSQTWAADSVEPEDPRFTRGAIIGVADLVGVNKLSASKWALQDHWHLELANPVTLAKPIPFTGALGLRRLDPANIARIEGELK